MFNRFKLLSAVLAGSLVFSGMFAGSASARKEDFPLPERSVGSVSIFSNSGGSIGLFALRAAKLRESRTPVRFTGRCDSACTLLLSLPSSQTCVSEGAVFRFHAPKHPSAKAARYAKDYMMRKYPRWVQAWIGRNRGLSNRLITMDYKYASRYLRTCVG